MYRKLVFLIALILMITVCASAGPSSSTDIRIIGLMDNVALGMPGNDVAKIVKANHEDAKEYSDGVCFTDKTEGYEGTTLYYLWPEKGAMNQVVCSFPYGEDGLAFSAFQEKMTKEYGEPAASMSQGNLFVPSSEYEWSFSLDGKKFETKTSTGKVETQTIEAIEYFVEYEDSCIMILGINTDMIVYMDFLGSLRNIGGDTVVELSYTVLCSEDALKVKEAGYVFLEPESNTGEPKGDPVDNDIQSAEVTEGDFTFSIKGEKATVTNYSGSAQTVKVPAEVSGCPVTAIEGFGNGYNDLSNVIIPAGITDIDNKAFSAFSNISFTVDSKNASFASIDGSLYSKTTRTLLFGKSGALNIPEGIEAIAPDACRARKFTSVTIPDSVKVIGERAFEKANISSIEFGTGIEKICTEAFLNAGLSRKALNLPDSLLTIEDRAFKNFGVVSDIKLGNKLQWIGDEAFAGLDILGTCIQYYPCVHSSCHQDYSSSFSISLSSLKHLGRRAFADIQWVHKDGSGGYCNITKKFTSVDGEYHYYSYPGTLTIQINGKSLEGNIPEGAFDQSAGRYAGWNMTKTNDPQFYVVVSVVGDSGNLTIGADAFRGTSSVSLPSGACIVSIGSRAFENTRLIGTLSFSDDCTTLSSGAFHNCRGLTLEQVPESITTIEGEALATSDISTIELGPQIEYIADDAFAENVLFTVSIDTYAEKWAVDHGKKYQYAETGESDLSWLRGD